MKHFSCKLLKVKRKLFELRWALLIAQKRKTLVLVPPKVKMNASRCQQLFDFQKLYGTFLSFISSGLKMNVRSRVSVPYLGYYLQLCNGCNWKWGGFTMHLHGGMGHKKLRRRELSLILKIQGACEMHYSWRLSAFRRSGRFQWHSVGLSRCLQLLHDKSRRKYFTLLSIFIFIVVIMTAFKWKCLLKNAYLTCVS